MSISAPRDDNRIPTLLAASAIDGEATSVKATNHRLLISDGTTGTSLGDTNASRDANRIPVLLAVSSVDGVTPVEVYADVDGKLLVTFL